MLSPVGMLVSPWIGFKLPICPSKFTGTIMEEAVLRELRLEEYV